MIYVVSDLHGYPLSKFKKLLEKVHFSENDFCYVLGDVIDRGNDGIKILKWLMQQKNVKLILGNHEAMMLASESALGKIMTNKELTKKELDRFGLWYYNGAEPTVQALVREPEKRIAAIFDYLRAAPLYECITVGDRQFVLSHSGLGNFDKDRALESYTEEELVWNRPGIADEYYSDKTLVFGHTPTVFFGPEYDGRAIVTGTWIDVDAGVACGRSPMLLRLDDMKEFYLGEV